MTEFLLSDMNPAFNQRILGDMLASPLTFPPVDSKEGPLHIVRTLHNGVSNVMLSHQGVDHCYDPDSNTIAGVRTAFRDFAENTTGMDTPHCIALVEGPEGNGANEVEYILTGGESGLIYHLGKVANIPVLRAEPPQNCEAPALFSRFSKEEVILFYVTREATQYHQLREAGATHMSMEEYIRQALHKWSSTLQNSADVGEVVQLDEGNFTYETFVRAHNELLGIAPYKAGNRNDYLDLMTEYIYPSGRNRPVSRVCAASNELRDVYKADLLLGYLLAGWSVFQLQGWFHARAMEPIVRNAEHILRKVQ